MKSPRKAKKKAQRKEEIPHDFTEEKLNETFGEENRRSMPDEVFWQLRFEPARWIAEKACRQGLCRDGWLHQDEFLRGDHPVPMFRGSIATPSLVAVIINSKYVNSNPLDCIARDFQTNGLNLSKQTMSNLIVWSAEHFFLPVYEDVILPMSSRRSAKKTRKPSGHLSHTRHS